MVIIEKSAVWSFIFNFVTASQNSNFYRKCEHHPTTTGISNALPINFDQNTCAYK